MIFEWHGGRYQDYLSLVGGGIGVGGLAIGELDTPHACHLFFFFWRHDAQHKIDHGPACMSHCMWKGVKTDPRADLSHFVYSARTFVTTGGVLIS